MGTSCKTLFTFTFAKRWIQCPPNANQEVSNTSDRVWLRLGLGLGLYNYGHKISTLTLDPHPQNLIVESRP